MSKNIVEQAKADVKAKQKAEKAKQKEENKMNNSNKKTIIVTVLLTITSLAVIAGLLYAGFNFGRDYESNRNSEVQAKVMELTAKIEHPSKQ